MYPRSRTADKETAVNRAIEHVGSVSEFAEKLGLTKGAVYAWNWHKPPIEHVLAIEALTNGRVKRHELRPDIYPKEKGR